MTLRSFLYKSARLLGNVDAATKGPVPYVKRRARAKVYAKVNGGLWRSLKKVGLG
jgi:hypothetical protein